MSGAEQVMAVEGLFAETRDGPRLLGSRCATCETAYFPRSVGCHNPDCDASKMEDAHFGPRGTLWSLSLQNYPPPAPVVNPEPYEPFAVGLVDLEDGLRVLGRLDTADPMSVEVGCDVELVIASLGPDADGNDIVSWQFKPL